MKDIALAVVVKHNKVLMQHRYRKQDGMVFEFPGGAIDVGETPQDAAQRELSEETGLKARAVLTTYDYKNAFGGTIYFVLLNILSDAEPVEVDKARQQSFHWFALKDIPQEKLFEADQAFIKHDLPQYLLS